MEQGEISIRAIVFSQRYIVEKISKKDDIGLIIHLDN